MLKIDSKMLVDSFTYEEFVGDGGWGDTEYAKLIEVEHVRIDRNAVFSRDKTQTQIVADSIIFCYASSTTPFIEFKEQSRVTFDNKHYIIKKVVTVKEPYRDKVWAYELEVI